MSRMDSLSSHYHILVIPIYYFGLVFVGKIICVYLGVHRTMFCVGGVRVGGGKNICCFRWCFQACGGLGNWP
jgi:hypothetical protein